VNSRLTRRILAIVIGALVMAMAVAPASYAGEDGDNGTTFRDTTSSGSGGDSGSASGGVQAGAGGMAVTTSQDQIVPELLAGTGVLVMAGAAGVAFRRRRDAHAASALSR
jgi:hypothetical protein